MLAKKYYAQRGNSKGKMNTSALTPSSSIAIRNKVLSKSSNVAKTTQDFTSQKYTDLIKYEVIKCSTPDNTTTRQCGSTTGCSGYSYKTESGIRTNRVSYVHKDIVNNSQQDYIQKIKELRSCMENDPKPFNNITGGCV